MSPDSDTIARRIFWCAAMAALVVAILSPFFMA
jgi:cytochrome c oxidase assembly factor CtaG